MEYSRDIICMTAQTNPDELKFVSDKLKEFEPGSLHIIGYIKSHLNHAQVFPRKFYFLGNDLRILRAGGMPDISVVQFYDESPTDPSTFGVYSSPNGGTNVGRLLRHIPEFSALETGATVRFFGTNDASLRAIVNGGLVSISPSEDGDSGERNLPRPVPMYIQTDADAPSPPTSDDAHFGYRELSDTDAELVNDSWRYGGNAAGLSLVRRSIQTRCSMGLFERGTGVLVSWALQYPYGAIGFVHTREAYRRRGLARRVVSRLADAVRQRDGGRCFAFIDLYNEESRTMFRQLGFRDTPPEYHIHWVTATKS